MRCLRGTPRTTACNCTFSIAFRNLREVIAAQPSSAVCGSSTASPSSSSGGRGMNPSGGPSSSDLAVMMLQSFKILSWLSSIRMLCEGRPSVRSPNSLIAPRLPRFASLKTLRAITSAFVCGRNVSDTSPPTSWRSDSEYFADLGRPPGFPLTPGAKRVEIPCEFPFSNGRPLFAKRLRTGVAGGFLPRLDVCRTLEGFSFALMGGTYFSIRKVPEPGTTGILPRDIEIVLR
jgi:hypothetical protein